MAEVAEVAGPRVLSKEMPDDELGAIFAHYLDKFA